MADPPSHLRGRGSRVLVRWAGGLSVAAGAAHGSVSAEHFREWWGYGVFFILATTAQMVLGLALLTNAVNPRDSGRSWRTLWLTMLWCGIVGNLLILGLYLVTRTVGIPWFGPGAGSIEEIGLVDVVTGVFEAATVALLAILVSRTPSSAPS
jgi:hypothetical protein